ncbi:MAG: dolichyl-phosphate-mannose-protein mannosyltransferase [Frankiales bacterium]|nr:dolichyl-phosphate-mannose-protein mannosyltransferase [Frankiales bacterium]
MRPLPPDRLVGWLATAGVTLLAGVLRFWHLSQPHGKIFDEVYYANDAHKMLLNGVEPTKAGTSDGFVVHPPLGKWIIGLGEKMLGFNESGWRVMAAVFGTLTVLVLIRTARRMTGSTLLGCVAGLLLALDGLHLVFSRTALLDGFLTFFIVVAFACLVADRDDGRRRLADRLEDNTDDAGPGLGLRWWRLASAVSLGAACSVKWSGIFFVLLFPLLAFAWDVGARRTAGIQHPLTATFRRDVLPALGMFVVLVPLVYTASWSGWFLSDNGWDRHYADVYNDHWPLVPDAIRSWLHYHRAILHFHMHLGDNPKDNHPYMSHPIGWLVLARPVAFFYSSPKGVAMGCHAVKGCSREVLGVGTPAIWWASIPALVLMGWYWISRRDWRAGAVLACFLFAFVPWIVSDINGRIMFNFYALPCLPFMILAITLVLGRVLGPADADDTRRTWGAVASGAYLLVVVLNFFYLYPVLVAKVISYDHWRHLMWLNNNWI